MKPNRLHENPAVFNARFARCRKLLYFVACRLLDCIEASAHSERLAKDAVQRCWLTASRNPPKLSYEGAFRSWLIRILIEESLAIRRANCEPNLALECTAHIRSCRTTQSRYVVNRASQCCLDRLVAESERAGSPDSSDRVRDGPGGARSLHHIATPIPRLRDANQMEY